MWFRGLQTQDSLAETFVFVLRTVWGHLKDIMFRDPDTEGHTPRGGEDPGQEEGL